MNLARIMQERGLNQAELARRSGIPQPLISFYLRTGKGQRLPGVEKLIALAKALNCSPNELLDWPEEKKPSDRSQHFWDALQKLPPDDPKRKAIETLLGLSSDTDVNHTKSEPDKDSAK